MSGRKGDSLLIGITISALLLSGGGLVAYILDARLASADGVPTDTRASEPATAIEFTFQRARRPDRTEVTDGLGRTVAVFTDGARTVRFSGPQRTFSEPRFTKAKVRTDAWIRLAPREWRAGAESEGWFSSWFDGARTDRSPDVLAIAMQYVYGAEPITSGDGVQIAGDAAFGPISETDADGRAENSDFYDYLGVPWLFAGDQKEDPDVKHIRSLDCSGYIRMVYGYRSGYPLHNTNGPGQGLPRRAFAMAEFGPGIQLVPNTGRQVRELALFQPGDLLFFHGRPEIDADGRGSSKHIEHSGIYLGIDDTGHHRFVSSRAGANGPTMGDFGGESIIDGTGHFASKLRTARRI